MIYATLCSGIGAPEVAFSQLGWTSAFAAEIEPFPSAVLAQRHPHIPNLGNIIGLHPDATIDLLMAGTPCQSFSIAGNRAGLDDPRGILVWEFLRIVGELRPRWVVWENVPGVLSIDKGRAFGAILRTLEQLRYGWAYRVLDAQYFGVPQRRRRVFVVGHLGDWRRSAAVLFDTGSLCGNPPPRRKKRPDAPAPTTPGPANHSANDSADNLICDAVTAKWAKGNGGPAGDECQDLVVVSPLKAHHDRLNADQSYVIDPATLISHILSGEGHDASEDGTGRGTPIIFEPRDARNGRGAPDTIAPPLKAENGKTGKGDGSPCVAFSCKDSGHDAGETSPTLRACNHIDGNPNGGGQVAVAFKAAGQEGFTPRPVTPPIAATDGGGAGVPSVHIIGGRDRVALPNIVRRLTPRECERLQGFPDDYTFIEFNGKPAKDSSRYRAIGNSMAVPVIRWLAERLAAVDELSGVIEGARHATNE